MNSDFNDIARPTYRFTGLPNYDGGEFGSEPKISGGKRSISVNRQHIENTDDGLFHIETLLPYAAIAAGLFLIVYKNV